VGIQNLNIMNILICRLMELKYCLIVPIQQSRVRNARSAKRIPIVQAFKSRRQAMYKMIWVQAQTLHFITPIIYLLVASSLKAIGLDNGSGHLPRTPLQPTYRATPLVMIVHLAYCQTAALLLCGRQTRFET